MFIDFRCEMDRFFPWISPGPSRSSGRCAAVPASRGPSSPSFWRGRRAAAAPPEATPWPPPERGNLKVREAPGLPGFR